MACSEYLAVCTVIVMQVLALVGVANTMVAIAAAAHIAQVLVWVVKFTES